MPSKVILLSGPICSGKTVLGDSLADRYVATRIKTKELIKALQPGTRLERSALQEAGEVLDRRTSGSWVGDALAREVERLPEASVVVVDAVRIPAQIHHIRRAFGPKVTHIHLTASDEELAKRYKRRTNPMQELPEYRQLKCSETEAKIEQLGNISDVLIQTDRCTPSDVLVRAAARLGLYTRSVEPLVDVLVGGQYGSEGKGHIASYLAREYSCLVRVGGPNAGHKVFRDDGPYTFHSLPSGTFRSDAKLIIGPGANIRVETLLQEIADWNVTSERLSIDPNVMIIEDRDIEMEIKLKKTIGSTGQGVGPATARRINERGKVRLAKDVEELRPFIRDTGAVLEDCYRNRELILLEGTQGTSLSLYHGDYPWVTSRDTTVSGCLAETGISPRPIRRTVIVCRTYPIRVGGTSGPMAQEVFKKDIAKRSGIPYSEILRVERTSTTNRPRRIGEFDWEQLKKSAVLNGPSDVAITFTDYLDIRNREARRFEQLTEETLRFIQEIENVSGAPVSLISTRFDYRSIIDRRAW